ncbi:MAG: class I SAM-dependent methyltransferase [Verrucomicrobia bacterium]|nr:class I SAM-dependent methyltransferase [Verrucomicrobiota bacterium]
MKYSNDPWRIKTCPRCGFVYLENPPEYEALKDEVSWEKTSAAERTRRNEAEPTLQRAASAVKTVRKKWLKRDKLPVLLKAHVKPGPVVDIGCGGGAVIARLGAEGYVPCGVEISTALAAKAQATAAKFGGRVAHNNALAGLDEFADGHFSGAVLSAFLEHEANPLPLLEKLRMKLAAGGAAIIKVPNFGSWNRAVRGRRWCGFRFPDHVNYFTPRTLKQMVAKAGLSVRKFTAGDRFPLSDNMWMVCQKS